MTLRRSSLLLILPALVQTAAAAPQWIWSSSKPKTETIYLRHEFDLAAAPAAATLHVSCDNGAEVWLNGASVAKNSNWDAPVKKKLAGLKAGKNVIAVKATNEGPMAGFVLKIDAGNGQVIESSPAWKASSTAAEGWEKPEFAAADWKPAVSVGNLGDVPWNDVFSGAAAGQVLDPEKLKLAPGFQAELLYTVPKGEQGSWVSLCVDDKGRLIAGDQGGGLYRLTLKDGAEPDVQPLETKVGHAQGLLYANNALYVVVNGPGPGLYRLRDTNGDDKFDEETLLRKIDGGGEHGPHAVVLAPDGKSLYVLGGNHTAEPSAEKSRVPRLWQEDHLIPRMWDANGHAKGILAPGGWICRTDFDGKEWEMVSMGYRNQYDAAFTAWGDLFAYDADMEWDVGTPWYRPTRICHAVPGSEFGWRSGSGKWPVYYPDSLPPTVDIGPGSPTGVVSGHESHFPGKYRHAIYAADWTFGTMYAIHLKASGGGWIAEKEEFVSGKPLPLTDMVIRPQDGAMYFLVGGRGTQSGLYRVSALEKGAPAPAPALTAEMKLRQELEALQVAAPSAEALEKAWAQMGHPDRWVRFAARSVVELQPVQSWALRAVEATGVDASLNALLALARAGTKEMQEDLLMALAKHDFGSMSEEQKLNALRVGAVCFVRMGMPTEEIKEGARRALEPHFPSKSAALNKELCEMLVTVDSPQVVSKTLQLLATANDDANTIASDDLIARNDGYAKDIRNALASRPNRQQIAYAFALRVAKTGWSPEQRRQYFRWFNTARKFQGGNSLRGFIEMIRNDALENVPAEMKAELNSLSEELTAAPADLPRPQGPGKLHTMDSLLALTKTGLTGRSYENGQKMYAAALCASCHQFGQQGLGGIGPDLTGAGNRYTMKDFLENILEPSKVISDQYESALITKQDGSSIVGRIAREEGDVVRVAENPFNVRSLTEVKKQDIRSREKYPLSAMPPGLLNSMNDNEVLDLIAYILSGGNKDDKAFVK